MGSKILSIFGTRPEAIKMAPVIAALERSVMTSVVCVTAQHREMLEQALNLFDIRPDYDLQLMKPDQTLAELSARALTSLDQVIADVQPDWVLVQGDTTTAMAGALAAFYRRVRVGHVEAGLRSFDRFQPFPEEVNRRIVTQVADLHFAPTAVSRQNLINEGVPAGSVIVTGNTVIDALKLVAGKPFEWADSPLATIPRDRRLILVTAHRRENFGQPIENICAALRSIAERHRDLTIVYPVHLNPNIKQHVSRLLGAIENIALIEPLDYLPLVHLLKASYLVVTDSGGLQEEAPGLGKPVLVLREVTERPEGVEAGTVRLVGTDTSVILNAVEELLTDEKAYASMAMAVNPYGDGHAGERIVTSLL